MLYYLDKNYRHIQEKEYKKSLKGLLVSIENTYIQGKSNTYDYVTEGKNNSSFLKAKVHKLKIVSILNNVAL